MYVVTNLRLGPSRADETDMVRTVASDALVLRDQVAARVAALQGDADIEEFARRYYAGVDDEDLATRSVDDLAEAALAHWRLARQRRPGRAIVRVTAPGRGHTTVAVVNDDMPFLVDSVTMALDRHDLGIHLVVHPILRVRRSAEGELRGLAPDDASELGDDVVLLESWLFFEVDRESSDVALEALRLDIENTLSDVRAATTDWVKMLSQLAIVGAELDQSPPPVSDDELSEGRSLLQWLGDQHFTFLGYRTYDLVDENTLRPVPGSGLGILRDAPEDASESFAQLPDALRAKARERTLLVLTKANSRSTVHRPTYLDYIGVKRFDANGNVVGEHRFLGLYTSTAYVAPPAEVPVLRRKVAIVIERAALLPASHDYKDLLQILDTYPRDDLFQIDTDALLKNALAILRIHERRQVRLIVQEGSYGRFISCLVYLPRDRYTTSVREHMAHILMDAYGALSYEWNTRLSESALARLHYVLHVDPSRPREVDEGALEQRVAAAARAWVDALRDALVDARGEESGLDTFREWSTGFPGAYEDDFNAETAVADIGQLEQLQQVRPLAVHLSSQGDGLDLKLYGMGMPPSLSDVLPRLANMGVTVDDEHPYTITPMSSGPRWMKWFRLHAAAGVSADSAARRVFEDAFLAVVDGRVEDDGLNRLVLGAGLEWREVALLRAYCRYLRQTGTMFSQAYMEETLARHCDLARRLVELFTARLDPWGSAASEGDGAVHLADTYRAGARCSDEPRRRPHPARALESRARDAAHELVLRQRAVRRTEAGPGPDSRLTAPPPAVRSVRVLAARRRRASARGQGRTRRHSLVGSPRRLPHRSARVDEGAARKERGDRARGREGRLRREATSGRSRATAQRGRSLLPRVHRRPARHHRQPRRRHGGATTAGRPLRR